MSEKYDKDIRHSVAGRLPKHIITDRNNIGTYDIALDADKIIQRD